MSMSSQQWLTRSLVQSSIYADHYYISIACGDALSYSITLLQYTTSRLDRG
jgi:hypothetical protein